MQEMKFFIDTHDHRSSTFPAGITKEQFQEFFSQYEKASREDGVVVLRAHVGLADGRAYCFNMAPSAEHVRQAHEHAGLPFESITEVVTATPGDLSFTPKA
jgi:uncharacterized protein DUF4242